jgi:hypothetical protein
LQCSFVINDKVCPLFREFTQESFRSMNMEWWANVCSSTTFLMLALLPIDIFNLYIYCGGSLALGHGNGSSFHGMFDFICAWHTTLEKSSSGTTLLRHLGTQFLDVLVKHHRPCHKETDFLSFNDLSVVVGNFLSGTEPSDTLTCESCEVMTNVLQQQAHLITTGSTLCDTAAIAVTMVLTKFSCAPLSQEDETAQHIVKQFFLALGEMITTDQGRLVCTTNLPGIFCQTSDFHAYFMAMAYLFAIEAQVIKTAMPQSESDNFVDISFVHTVSDIMLMHCA